MDAITCRVARFSYSHNGIGGVAQVDVLIGVDGLREMPHVGDIDGLLQRSVFAVVLAHVGCEGSIVFLDWKKSNFYYQCEKCERSFRWSDKIRDLRALLSRFPYAVIFSSSASIVAVDEAVYPELKKFADRMSGIDPLNWSSSVHNRERKSLKSGLR